MKRYCPSMEFPPYSFIPTKNLSPNKIGGYREGIADPISKTLDKSNYAEHKEYLFAIDLINNGYYWESHVYFESIWHAHHRKGAIASYCKALVKMAAGAIKIKQGRIDSAERLFEGANENLINLPVGFYLGIEIKELISLSKRWIIEGQKEIKLDL